MRKYLVLVIATLGVSAGINGSTAFAQISTFPFFQNFDSVQPPALPPGWTSTQYKTPGTNDFVVASGSALSPPNALLSTNATLAQALVSPSFNFTASRPDSIAFFTRRSATHGAKVLLEVSLDDGGSFGILLGDTLRNPGSLNYVRSAFGLPPFLAASPAVKFRWRVIPDVGGQSGTFRIDDIAVTAQSMSDLALVGLRFMPAMPVAYDTVSVVAMVRNVGQQEVRSFWVHFYRDVNNDSIPQSSELMASVSEAAPLAAGHSAELSAPFGIFPPGSLGVIAIVSCAGDQNPRNDSLVTELLVGYPSRSVVINEIMYAPSGSEPEWIELHNVRPDSVNIRNWLVSDNAVTNRRSITTRNIAAPPHGYVLLTKDSAGLVDVHPRISSRIIQVSELPTLNNTGDAVVLYDSRGATMDSLMYTPGWGGNSGGRSLERRDPLTSSTLQSNWGTSRHISGSTPGARNSLALKEYDLRLDTLLTAPALPLGEDTLRLMARVHNAGTQDANNYILSFFEDINADSVADPSELLGSLLQLRRLDPLDSLDASLTLTHVRVGFRRFMARLDYAPDEDTTNNSAFGQAYVGVSPGTLRINEVMYAPPAGMPEWVELVNCSHDTLDVGEWRIGNRSSSRYPLSPSSLTVFPNNYLVITKDTALLGQFYPGISSLVQSPSLPTFLWNNAGDAVVLADNRKVVMDSLMYSAAWGGASGTSLERIDVLGQVNDSTNWASSQAPLRATPGRQNSILLLDDDLRAVRGHSISITQGQIAGLSMTVSNGGRLPSGEFRVLFYDDADGDSTGSPNELVAQTTISRQVLPRDSLIVTAAWGNVPSGMHSVLGRIEYGRDMRGGNNVAFFTVRAGYAGRTLIMNEIMYAPLPGNAEYVELANTSRVNVDLHQWKLTDRPSASGIANAFALASVPRILHPDELFLIAADSSVFTLFPHLRTVAGRLVTIVGQSSLSLNDDGDDLVLRDPAGFAVDSVAYRPFWHRPGTTDCSGRALEKIAPQLAATDARSWSTCVNSIGGTPALRNSVFASALPSRSRLSLAPNPFSPDGDGWEDFTIIHYELPLQLSTIRIRIYDVRGRLIRTLVNNEASASAGDVVWDGRDDDRQKARIGMYVVLLDAIDERGGIVESTKGIVVLAAKL